MKKLILFLILPVLVVGIGLVLTLSDDAGPTWRRIPVERGAVVREVVAAGRIEPEFEVPLKSTHGGILTRRFAALGQRVTAGEPLVEVRPVFTDMDLLQAERALQSAVEAQENVEEFRAGENLMGRTLLFLQGRDSLERMKEGTSRARSAAEEQLELLREGKAEIGGKVIDFLVRSPIDGHVIEMSAEEGEPVVPSSSYGSGTVLMVLADMDRLVFRGTANEVDVGRLREGMGASISVGALPGAAVSGELVSIALRSRTVNNATVFDVKLSVERPPDVVLRSGYSAVARVEVARAEDVLVLSERVVDYREGSAFVRVDDGRGGDLEREVQTGLSDGLNVEITGGLAEGDVVLERIY